MKSALPLALLLAAAPATAAAPGPAPTAANPVPHPLRLGLSPASAFGLSHAGFVNHLVGARVDYRFTSRFAFGAALSYVNLKGKDGRVSNVLPEWALAYCAPLTREGLGLPLRLALGFLPENGPTLRLGAGIDLALSPTVSLELVPLEPMVWITRDAPEVSLNGSAALYVAF